MKKGDIVIVDSGFRKGYEAVVTWAGTHFAEIKIGIETWCIMKRRLKVKKEQN